MATFVLAMTLKMNLFVGGLSAEALAIDSTEPVIPPRVILQGIDTDARRLEKARRLV